MCEPRHVDFYQYCRCGCLEIIPIAQRFADGHGLDVVAGAGDAPPPHKTARRDDTATTGVPDRPRVAVTGPGQGARTGPTGVPGVTSGRPPTGDQ